MALESFQFGVESEEPYELKKAQLSLLYNLEGYLVFWRLKSFQICHSSLSTSCADGN